MSKYEEKMKALAVLKTAVDKVEDALEAIDAFADSISIMPEKEKTVELPELAAMVAKKIKMRPCCVCEVLVTAFDLIRELNLMVVVEEDEDDDE